MAKNLAEKVRDTQIWKSIFRHGPPNNARNRAAVVAGNVFSPPSPHQTQEIGGSSWVTRGVWGD